jgi:hypothetical protein
MYVPATPQSAAPLVPVGIAATDPTIVTPVNTALHVRGYQLNVATGHRASVTGTLLEDHQPAVSGELVTLQARSAHGWRTLASARTGERGHFRISYIPGRARSRWVRLRFAGNALARASRRPLGRLNVYRLAEATSSNTRSFVQCVTEHESGLRWHIVDPPFSGGDQWTQSTWLAAGGGRFAPTAAEATPRQQIGVFLEYEPRDPGAWPVTVPACS